MTDYILAIDQGTTNSRAIIFDRAGRMLAHHDMPLKQQFPHDGWVEQDPEELYQNTVICCREVIKKLHLEVRQIAAIGISNQRETTIVWDKITGRPIYPAIVWQDRRTSELCQELSMLPIATHIPEKTGLLLDPYFSATKLIWILDHVKGARERAERQELLFGTVDTYLLWKLTGGKVHATDVTNASRTLLFNIKDVLWDDDILTAFAIPKTMLPEVFSNTHHFGDLIPEILGHPLPITGIAGDQQAATIGQACFKPGMLKVTYGTGCFLMLNTGSHIIRSQNQLLSTIAYRIGNETCYGLEGSIFSGGTIIKWLRDQLQLISSAKESETFARELPDNGGVYFVPAFTGLGAPYWDPEARAAIVGLLSNSNKKHIVRAALESVAYQTRDLFEAMMHDLRQMKAQHAHHYSVRVDGGMTVNKWLLQFISDTLNLPVERPQCIETTALGAAYLAGLQVGIYDSTEDIARNWRADLQITPQMPEQEREKLYRSWLVAVESVLSH